MKKLMYFAAALLVLVGCNKKDNALNNAPEGTPFEKGQKVTLTIGTGAQQGPNKVAGVDNTIDDQIDFTWEEGDQILVKVGENTATFTLSSGEGTADGEFAGEMPAAGSSFDIQYPIEEPALSAQEYTTDKTIPANKMLFTATGCVLGTPAILEAQYAMVQLNLYGTDMTIGKIVFKNMTAEPVESYTLTCTGGKTIGANSEEATPFYMVVPTGEYQFEVEVYDAAATPAMICSFATSAAQTFVADKCLNMPAKEVKAAPQEVEWTNALSLGKQTATAIVIETGVDVSGYEEDGSHKPLNDDKTLWEVLDGTTLRIQTAASQINSNLENLFDGCKAAESITGLGNIHATTAENMFSGCTVLQSLDLSGFNTEDITDMSSMFDWCDALTNLDLSCFNTENVEDMYNMFRFCRALTSLDLSSFNTENVADMSNMFEKCKALESLTLSNNFKVASEKEDMFESCGCDTQNGCTVYGVTDASIKTALKTETSWNDSYMHFAAEE
ncbi:MAG: DUF285 domain-containing protein [Paludibacteraceae bacterium]|nr:DUF285 domain-containing protein [Paludibacteraceae bacterium]